jgi:hypothetical protein
VVFKTFPQRIFPLRLPENIFHPTESNERRIICSQAIAKEEFI